MPDTDTAAPAQQEEEAKQDTTNIDAAIEKISAREEPEAAPDGEAPETPPDGPEKTTDSEPEDTSLSANELRALKGLDVSEDELQELPDDIRQKVLDKALSVQRTADKQFGTLGRALRDAKTPSSTETPDPTEDEPESEPMFDPDEWGESAAKTLNEMAAQMKAFQGKFDDQESQRANEHQAQQFEQADQYLSDLDTKLFPELAGIDLANIQEDSPEYATAETFMDEVFAQIEGRKSRGMDLSMADALDMATRILYPEASHKAASKELSDKITKRGKQRTARPTQRQSPATTDENSHTRAAMKKVGLIA